MKVSDYLQPSELSARAWVVAGFFLPINKSISVAAMVLVGLFAWSTPQNSTWLRNLKYNKLLWLPAFYFVWHLLSYLWSENKHYASRDLETKLSFFLLPLLIGATAPGQRQRLNFFISLTVGVMLNGLWSLFNAFQAYEADGLSSHFFYIELSRLIHVAYLTMMVTMCLLYLIYDLFYSRKMDPQPWALTTAMLLLCLFTVLLDSRTAFFTMLLAGLTFFIVTIISLNKVRNNLFPLLLFLALFGTGYYMLSRVHNRMAELQNVVKTINMGEETSQQTEEDYGNAGVRPVLWKNAIAVISENTILGVGCGDLKDALKLQYEKSNFETGVKFNLNPHNQYLHTTVGTGVVGLILLIAMLFIPFFVAIKKKNWFIAACLSVFIMNTVTESVLEVQNGILLFTIVYSLLIPELHKESRIA